MPRRTVIRTTVIGTGRLARALVPLLDAAGHPVAAVVGRKLRAARSTARSARRAIATTSLRRGAEAGSLILLAVSDRSIAGVGAALSRVGVVDWKTRTVLHHAGALGPDTLLPLREAGAAVGVLHPLQSLGRVELARELLLGSRARIEGDRKARTAARHLARSLGLVPLDLGKITPRDRTAYHAAASVASNDVLALLTIAADLLMSVGLSRRRALDALLPLVRGTLRQIEARGLSGPLTGPASRGDVATLRDHLRRLRSSAPGDREIHRLLSLRLARLALEYGEEDAAATTDALAGRSERRGV